MILLVKTKTDDIKKALIRNQVFHEVDIYNKKVGNLPSAQIKSVYWPKDGEITEYKLADFIKMAEDANFWGLE